MICCQKLKRICCTLKLELIISILCFLVVFLPTLVALLLLVSFKSEASLDESTQSQNGNYTSYNNDTESQSSASEHISVTWFVVGLTVTALLALTISISMFYLLTRTKRGRALRYLHARWGRKRAHEIDIASIRVPIDMEKEETYLRYPSLSHKQNISDITVQTKAPVENDKMELRMIPKYTEVSRDVNRDSKVQIVMPLGALDQTLDTTKPCRDPSNQTSTSQSTPEFSVSNEITEKHTKPSQTVCVLEPDVLKHRLDWNKLFTFMANNINSLEWKLFFIELFGHCQHLLPRGMDVNSIIEQTESDRKGGSIRTFFFELLIEWRKVMGNEACPSLIEASLKQMGDTIKLGKFTAFMRNPPLLPEKLPHSILSIETEVLKPLLPIANQTSCDFMHTFTIPEQQPQAQIMALHDVIRSQSCTNLNDTVYSRSHEASGLAIRWKSSDEVNVPDRASLPGTSGSAHNRRVLSRESYASYVSLRGKRPRTYYDTSSSDSEEVIPFKNRKYDNILAIKCHELIQWEKVGFDFLMEVIIKQIQSESTVLEANEYNLFLHHTVSLLIKKTGYPEETILSVLVEDYENTLQHNTKRGYAAFLIDTSGGILTLGGKEWDCLKLYAEKARTRIIERQLKNNDEFVASKYLFIDYDGQLLAKQENVDVSTATKEDEIVTEPKIMEGVQTGDEFVKESESHVDQSATPHFCTNLTPLNPAIGTSNMSKEDVFAKQENVDVATTTKEGKFTKPKIMEDVQRGEEDIKDLESSVDKFATPQLCTNISPLNTAFETSNMSKEDVLAKQKNVDVSTTTNEGEKITEPKIMEGMQKGGYDLTESESHFDKSATSHLCTNITPPECKTSNMPKEDVRQSVNTLKQPGIKDHTIDIKESSYENSGENLDNPGGTVQSLFVLDVTQCSTFKPSENKTKETVISHNNTETSTETIFSPKKERIVKENNESSKDMADEDIGSYIANMEAGMKEIAHNKETKTYDNGDNYADLDNPGGTVKSHFVLDVTQCGTFKPSENKTKETVISHNNTETSTETIFSPKKERIVKENNESSKDMANEDMGCYIANVEAGMKEIAHNKETKTNDNDDNYADN